MDLAMFVLRIVVGGLFAAHGAQKLFGSFGGHGIAGTGQFFESLGLKPGERHARFAGLGEFGGGVLLILGFLTPLGAAAIIGVMTVAVLTVHAPKGWQNTEGGYEYNVVLAAAAFALAGAGPGGWSIDHALGFDTGGAGWALAALGAGILGGMGALLSARGSGRRPQAQPAPRTVASPVPEPAEPRFARDEEPVRPREPQPPREPARSRDPFDLDRS
jgi:putative oxidoreductase